MYILGPLSWPFLPNGRQAGFPARLPPCRRSFRLRPRMTPFGFRCFVTSGSSLSGCVLHRCVPYQSPTSGGSGLQIVEIGHMPSRNSSRELAMQLAFSGRKVISSMTYSYTIKEILIRILFKIKLLSIINNYSKTLSKISKILLFCVNNT